MRKQTFAVRPVRMEDVAALRRLFVGEPWRGRGIGSKLLAEAEAEAERRAASSGLAVSTSTMLGDAA